MERGRDRTGTDEPLVTIIISNYNGAKFLRRALSSLRALDYPRVEVVLVDAGSTDGSAELVRREFPEVHVVQGGKMGIGAAINMGIAASRGDLLLMDYNSDEFASPSFLRTLVDALVSSDDIGAVGGVRLIDGSDGLIDSMGGMIFFFGDCPKLGRGKKYSEVTFRPSEVDYLAHFLVRRRLLQEVGLIDEDYYINGEDPDFCARITRAGYRVIVVPRAITFHAVSGTAGSSSPQYVYYFHRSMIRLMLKLCPLPLIPIGFLWTTMYGALYFLLRLSRFRRLIGTTSLAYLKDRGTPAHLRAFLDAVLWNLRHVRETFVARGSVKGTGHGPRRQALDEG